MWLLTLAAPAGAVEIHGNAQVFAGTTEIDGVDTQVTQQDYRVSFFQPFTPWLSLNVNYRYDKDRTSTDDNALERARSLPEIVLLYSRPTFTARLDYYEQHTSGTTPSDNFNLTSALAYFSWRPGKGPSYVLQYRDDSNVADVALFGRDTDSNLLQFDTVYDHNNWSLRFSHQDSDVHNNLTGFQLDQTRDLLRVNVHHRWLDGRYTLSAETWLSRVDQEQRTPAGASLAQPVRAVEGLFVIDLTPTIGALDPSSDLVDRDTETPVVPLIEIGGANTGRNIGVDLGITNRVSRLEITVDTLSGPSLLWDVYHSPDNFNWNLVGGVLSSFDDAFDRYTLLFPETTDRYFKAVNISVNALDNVAVTEIRALLDVDAFGRSKSKSSTYRLDITSSLKPHERVRGNLHLFLGNDEDIGAGRFSQEVNQLVFDSGWTFDAGHDLEVSADFRYSEFEQVLAPRLQREEQHYGVGLTWEPLETVRWLFEVTRRDESDDGQAIRTTDHVRARLAMQIYTALHLTSEISYTDVDDQAGNFTQSVFRWIETLESQPTRTWMLGGSSTLSWFDSLGIETVSRRVSLELFSRWQIVPYLTLSGLVGYTDDDQSENLHQRYTLSWAPGRKLAASIYYQDSDAKGTRRVTGWGGSMSYRLNRGLTLFANASHSQTEEIGFLITETTSGRLGLRVTF